MPDRGRSPGSPDSLGEAGSKMVRSGAVLGLLLLAAGTGLVWGIGGGPRGLGFLIGAAGALAAMCLGQVFLTLAWRRSAAVIFVVALAVYLLVVCGLVVLLVWLKRAGLLPMLWVGIGVGVGAYAYLAGAILAYRRARVPIFSPAGPTPPETGDGPAGSGTDQPSAPSSTRE